MSSPTHVVPPIEPLERLDLLSAPLVCGVLRVDGTAGGDGEDVITGGRGVDLLQADDKASGDIDDFGYVIP